MANREQFIQNFVQAGKAKGATPQEVSAKLKLALPEYDAKFSSSTPVQPKQPESPSLGGFMGNVVKSGANAVSGIAEAGVNAFNPDPNKNTVVNLAKIPLGVGGYIADKAYGEITGTPVRTNFLGSQDTVDNVVNSYKDRYGSFDKVKDTAYNDPVGTALDASMVLGAGGNLLGKVGTASQSANVSRVGSGFTKAAELVDPIRGAGTFVKKATKSVAGKAGELGTDLRVRSAGITSPQARDFEKATGTKIRDFMKQEDLAGRGTEKASKLIDEVNTAYNEYARGSGQVTKDELLTIFDRAKIELEALPIKTAEDLKVIKSIDKEAEIVKNQLDMPNLSESMPIKNLTDLKSKYFGQSRQNKGFAPTKANYQESLGQSARKLLEEKAPETRDLGQREHRLMQYEKIAKDNAIKGSTSNPFKLSTIGSAGAGAVVGGLPGLASGLVLEALINNPKIIAKLARGLEKTPTFLKKPELSKAASVFSKTYKVGKVGSRVKESK